MEEFNKIRDGCIENNVLWRDTEFPAEQVSLFNHQVPESKFEWMRPAEIYDRPIFIDDTFKAFDVVAGTLGEDWLVGCFELLHNIKGIFKYVVPPNQDFHTNYGGIFRFRIWWCGNWHIVMIDDRLPTVNGKLVFAHNSHSMQLWAALLEKAYAKLHGSYEAVKYGNTQDSLADLTGGVVDKRSLTSDDDKATFFKQLRSVSCIGVTFTKETEDDTPILSSTQYLIYEIDRVSSKSGILYLARLVRSLAPGEKEPEGLFAENYRPLWESLSPPKKQEIMSTTHGFWVPLKKLVKMIDTGLVIHFDKKCTEIEPTLRCKNKWIARTQLGKWITGVSAGGCRYNMETFNQNPQFQLVVNNSTSVIISLSQTNTVEVIGFSVFKLSQPLEEKATLQLLKSSECVFTSKYSNMRHVRKIATFEAGTYLILPTTLHPRKETKFTVRIFSVQPITLSNVLDIQPCQTKSILLEGNSTSRSHTTYDLIFLRLADENRTINAFDLQDILETSLPNDYVKSCATIETCRQIVLGMSGTDNTIGRINLENYKQLLAGLCYWEEIFRLHSTNMSGVLVVEKLRDALQVVGFQINDHLMTIVVFKFMRKDCTLRFGDFISAIFFLLTIFQSNNL